MATRPDPYSQQANDERETALETRLSRDASRLAALRRRVRSYLNRHIEPAPDPASIAAAGVACVWQGEMGGGE